MKNFIIRYLISYILTAIFYFMYREFIHENMDYFKYIIFYIIMPINLISTFIFYISIAYISKTMRYVILSITAILYIILPLIIDLHNPLTAGVYINIYYICLFASSQLIIPNFNYKIHDWDKKMKPNESLILIFVLIIIIIYYWKNRII